MKHETLHIKDLLHFSPKQEEARKAALKYRYVLYGGAMAGGKSYWLRWMLIYHLVRWAARGFEHVEVGLFCEDYPTLKDRQLSKIGSEFPQWLGTLHGDHPTHGRSFILADEYGGGIIKFRNLDDPSKYQSAEFAAIAVDELTKNTREVFDDLRNRLRWPGITDIRFLGATNPGGIGHAWVKKLWLDRIFDEEEQEKDEFAYIKALASDNPHIDKSYLKQLESLPPDKRRAYLEGDWDIFKGQYFSEWRRDIHVCQPFDIPADWRKFVCGDYGYNKPSAVYWCASAPDGELYVYRELYATGLNYKDLTDRIAAMTPQYETISYYVFDPAIWKHEPGNDASLTGAEIMQARWSEIHPRKPLENAPRSFALQQGDNNRITGWNALRSYLKPYYKQDTLTAKLQVFSTCPELIRTLPSLIYDEHKVEDLDTEGEDHAADAIRYGIMSRPQPAMTSKEKEHAMWLKSMKERRASNSRGRLFVP